MLLAEGNHINHRFYGAHEIGGCVNRASDCIEPENGFIVRKQSVVRASGRMVQAHVHMFAEKVTGWRRVFV